MDCNFNTIFHFPNVFAHFVTSNVVQSAQREMVAPGSAI